MIPPHRETAAAEPEQIDFGARHHVVQFYERDDELADSVTRYLLGAFRVGGAGVVVATEAHTSAFELGLTRAGLDVEAARARGAYVAVDAGDTIRELVADGRPDPAGFDAAVSRVISRAQLAAQPVRVYGEVVALLWDAGLVAAAIDLETTWNELGRRKDFSLLCAYRRGSVTRDEHLSAFSELCHLHAAIVGVPVAAAGPPARTPAGTARSRAFPASVHSPREARRFVLETLQGRAAEKLARDAAIVVTELATNAVLHARSAFTVAVSSVADAVRVSVRDGSPLPGAKPRAPMTVSPSHGLGVVALLAASWGIELLGDAGKEVWAELR
jgi:MEDS: MEthanogen/methylotroph, DcmR Sensory domain